jgi:hypothetical protein
MRRREELGGGTRAVVLAAVAVALGSGIFLAVSQGCGSKTVTTFEYSSASGRRSTPEEAIRRFYEEEVPAETAATYAREARENLPPVGVGKTIEGRNGKDVFELGRSGRAWFIGKSTTCQF